MNNNQSIQKIMMPQYLSSTYNLFAQNQIVPPQPLSKPSSNKSKKQIQIVFHHPNLLYLGKAKEGKEDVAKRVEENIRRKIQTSKSKRYEQSRTEEIRPKTCDPWSVSTKQFTATSQNRSKTSQGQKRGSRINRNKTVDSQGKLEVLGKSSSVVGSLFDCVDKPKDEKEEPSCPQKSNFSSAKPVVKKDNVLNILESVDEPKMSLWRRLFSSSNKNSIKLNMSLEAEKKFQKFNLSRPHNATLLKKSCAYRPR